VLILPVLRTSAGAQRDYARRLAASFSASRDVDAACSQGDHDAAKTRVAAVSTVKIRPSRARKRSRPHGGKHDRDGAARDPIPPE